MSRTTALHSTSAIAQFVERSLGQWRSQRSVHHLAFRHFEAVESEIQIAAVDPTDPEVLALCQTHGVDATAIVSPFRMTWDGQSDWNEEEVLQGTTVLVPVPDTQDSSCGQLLRDQGYAETVTAAATYAFQPDGTFVLTTFYDRAAAEEKIWFATPDLRFRVSTIKTSAGSGVLTASFSSEVRVGR